jgi:hypothetical protein
LIFTDGGEHFLPVAFGVVNVLDATVRPTKHPLPPCAQSAASVVSKRLTSVHRSVKLNVRFGTEGVADFDALHHPDLPRVL